jgi:hypothetical protein
MIKEMILFIRENELSPFNKNKTSVRAGQNIFRTADARAVHNRVLAKIGHNFCFSDTSNLFHFFEFAGFEEIKKRQDFFRTIEKTDNNFLSGVKVPRQNWKPKYDVVIATENEDTFLRLREAGCPVQYVTSPEDVVSLQECDIIQVLDCESTTSYLEQLPQTVFLNSEDEVYLERYLEILSGWRDNLNILSENKVNPEINSLVDELKPFLKLIEDQKIQNLSREYVNDTLEQLNEKILSKVKEMTLSGDSLVGILSKSKFPEEISRLIRTEVRLTNLPEEIFNMNLPISVDEPALNKFIKEQSANNFTNTAELIKKQAKELRRIPDKLQELADQLLIFDFLSGVGRFMSGNFPSAGELSIKNSKNIFLDNPQPVSFYLNSEFRCSVLTGANSGGKTTLLEHIIQAVSLFNLGLKIEGDVSLPIFSEVYYFAKNKGSMSKGAFETLLTQMAGIKPGDKTLILADEMEAVTEPSVAGDIVCATAKFFINRGCFMIIATHLGKEIQKNLPFGARVDGIEAKGLDENNELIVDHNPVLGKIANSTPELIVERLAKKLGDEYFKFLFEELSSA